LNEFTREFQVTAASPVEAVNAAAGFPAKGVRLERIAAKAVYRGFWRRLFRCPQYYEVQATFTVEPQEVTNP
jgi:hypothetical protein